MLLFDCLETQFDRLMLIDSLRGLELFVLLDWMSGGEVFHYLSHALARYSAQAGASLRLRSRFPYTGSFIQHLIAVTGLFNLCIGLKQPLPNLHLLFNHFSQLPLDFVPAHSFCLLSPL